MNVRTVRLPLLLIALSLVVAACGNDVTPSPTGVPATTDTPTGLTAGQLADRIATGWLEIDRYRAVTTTQHDGTPMAGSPVTEAIEEVILPNQRHQLVLVDGVEQSEIVAAGGNIYGRGTTLPGIEQPNRDPNVWITINGNVLGPNNSFSGFYQSLLLPVQPPYAGLSDDDRAKPAEELGSTEIGGRTCQQYRIVDTTLTGTRVEVTLSLADNGLVCAIETRSGNSVTSTIYTYDQPAQIDLPASPVPAPAENG